MRQITRASTDQGSALLAERLPEGADVASGRSIIELIQATWAETLRLDAVGPNDDFFELGGHSRMVAAVIGKLSERLGFELPLRALFQAPTPAELTELIAKLRREQDGAAADGITAFFPDWIVPLQREGAGRPVFVFPVGHSDVHALAGDARMAALVGREHPFWGFRYEHPGLEQVREGGVPALAAAYAAQIRAIQPKGPYLLYGACGGGYLAWEVARQLLAAGEAIAGILLYEVSLRSDFAELVPGQTPARISSPWRLSESYRPEALQVDLTFLMSEFWQDKAWWPPWRQVTLGTFETVVFSIGRPGAPDFADRRDATIARHVRVWIDQAESRLRKT